MFYLSYLNTAKKLIGQYNGSIPFAHFLKQYFATEKKHGSKDRKNISHFCYCYFRLGKALSDIDIEQKLKVAIFLCTEDLNKYASLFDETWAQYFLSSLNQKIYFLQEKYPSLKVDEIFYWNNELSEMISSEKFILSHLVQPDLFIRVRPEKKTKVVETLQRNNISFVEENNFCFRITNTTAVNNILNIDKDAVVQDLSSQNIALLINKAAQHLQKKQKPITVWDCCAASGGKSILVKDTLQNIRLTVSDVRKSIIANLQKRFIEAGISKYDFFTADLTKPPLHIPNAPFDLVICDAPCSGSGTWGRTPEQLIFFDKKQIDDYSLLQKNIALNTIKYVKNGGCFLYITCSVFRKENEDVVKYILENSSLQLLEEQYFIGYDKKADSMFGALFVC